MNTKLIIAVLTLLVGCVTQTVLAETPAKAENVNEGDYSYQFVDDDLLGGTLGDTGDMFRSRPPARRVWLLRPRTSLVQEIIKSAENL